MEVRVLPLALTSVVAYGMAFPWEYDAHPARKRGRYWQRQQQGLANKRRRNYETAGHPSWYPQYLETAHWRQFKERYRASKRPRCCMICGDRRYELHHITYDRVGQELLADVVPLCRGHHARAHKRERAGVLLKEAHLTNSM